jgi:hypothetical protein
MAWFGSTPIPGSTTSQEPGTTARQSREST